MGKYKGLENRAFYTCGSLFMLNIVPIMLVFFIS